MASNKVVRLSQIKVACSECSLRSLCLPLGLDKDGLDKLDKLVKRPKPLQRDQFLYRTGDLFRSIFVVRAGSVKTFTISQTGEQQITGFHLPGELIGLDGVGTDSHCCDAQALETTSICQLPFSQLEELSLSVPGLQKQLHRLMSKEFVSEQHLPLQLGKMNAEQRLASLLVNLSVRSAQRGFSATEFNLSMTRTNIGNYLGLAVETVSRQFTQFQEKALIKAVRRNIHILDLVELKRIAGLMECDTKQVNAQAKTVKKSST